MGTISKELLSGSTQGQPIIITATTSPGTIVHTTGTSSTTIDEIWLYANNDSAVQVTLTVQYGTGNIVVGIPSRTGLSILLPGLALTGNGITGTVVRAFAGTTSVISVVGYLNRIVP